MSVYIYDNAIVNMLRKAVQVPVYQDGEVLESKQNTDPDSTVLDFSKAQFVDDGRVNIVPFEKAFAKSGSVKDDVILPFVSLYRTGYSLTSITNTQTGRQRGKVAEQVGNDNRTVLYNIRNRPITINYLIDIVTRTRQENDELTRELIWLFELYPHLHAVLDQGNIRQKIGFNIFLGDDIVDNSEITEFESQGQYYRSTFDLIVDEAQLFLVEQLEGLITVKIGLVASTLKGEEEFVAWITC